MREALSAPVLGLVAGAFGLGPAFALGALLPVLAAAAGLAYVAQGSAGATTRPPA